MTVDDPDFSTVRFSTDDLPERDRFAIWREVLGRTMMRLDVERVPEHPFHSQAHVRALPGLVVQWGVNSGVRTQRTSELLADGNDDLVLSFQTAGVCIASQLGREVTATKGGALMLSSADIGSATFPAKSRFTTLILPRKALAPIAPGLEDAFVRPFPTDSEVLHLLVSYLNLLRNDHALSTPALRRIVVTHVYDLVGLAIGATRDAAATAAGRGVRAARLNAIKCHVAENLGRSDLSVGSVAALQRVTPRYVQKLFETEGTTFSDYVLGQRLARAQRMLGEVRYAGWSITAIAFECGFGDLSYFDRAFRGRYGATPSDVREAHRRRG
jgi:AraC-like DNA-binding protein